MNNLLSKYRPCTLTEVLGQPDVTSALSRYVKSPYSTSMLFHSESGTGKTSAAHAIAADLGVGVIEQELGGFFSIASGEMTGEAVRSRLNSLRYRPLFGSGWKCLVCNEADRMSAVSEIIWLDGLEHLPEKTVVIFTTNQPWSLSRRLRDRLENFAFTADAKTMKPAIRRLAKKVWANECPRRKMPSLPDLGMPTLGSIDSMHASFRLALHQLGRYISAALAGEKDFARLGEAVKDDYCYLGQEVAVAADCDHCGKSNDVDAKAKRRKCDHCGKTFKLSF
jgi:hypothetical protein